MGIATIARTLLIEKFISHAEKIFSLFEEHTEAFIKSRQKHSAVESAINALENHGLDRCPDHGIYGFKRYVALAVLARNIQILGAGVQYKTIKRMKSQRNGEIKLPLAA